MKILRRSKYMCVCIFVMMSAQARAYDAYLFASTPAELYQDIRKDSQNMLLTEQCQKQREHHLLPTACLRLLHAQPLMAKSPNHWMGMWRQLSKECEGGARKSRDPDALKAWLSAGDRLSQDCRFHLKERLKDLEYKKTGI